MSSPLAQTSTVGKSTDLCVSRHPLWNEMPVSCSFRHLQSLSDYFTVSPSLDCERCLFFPVGREGKKLYQKILMTPGQDESLTQHSVSVSQDRLMVVIKDISGWIRNI